MMGVLFPLNGTDVHQEGKHMHVYIKFNSYNGETKEEQTRYFESICIRLESFGYDLEWSKELFVEGRPKVGVINTDSKEIRAMDSVFVGLSLKRLDEHFDEVVIKRKNVIY
jgi:hypothetical protein